MKWFIVCDVQGKNPGTVKAAKSSLTGKNEGGVIVYLQKVDGKYIGTRQEVGRVAFVRANGTNKRKGFKPMLAEVLKTANDACDLINEQQAKIDALMAKAGELQ